MATLRAVCPECGRGHSVPTRIVGRTMRCSECQHEFEVTMPAISNPHRTVTDSKVCGTLESLSAVTVIASFICFIGGLLLILMWFNNPDSAPANSIPLAIQAFGAGLFEWMFGLMGQALVYIARKD